jgi:FkbM family methyltransferase
MIANEEVLSKFIKIQKAISPDISIEVGAHDADFSKEMFIMGIECFAFEASPYVFERYKSDLTNIKYINSAVSDKNGIIKFEVQPDPDPSVVGNNSIKNRNEIKEYSYIDVSSVTLDEYFKDFLFFKGVLWIDAEGASREVLMGSINKIKDFASIYIELELQDFWKDAWKRDDVVKYLEDNGFYLLDEVPCYGGQVDAIFINNNYKEIIDEVLSK